MAGGENMHDSMKKSIELLSKLENEELEVELGRRLAETRKQLQQGFSLTASDFYGPALDQAALQGPMDFLRDVARGFLTRFNEQMYALVCESRDPDNKKIMDALAAGTETLGYVLSGVFVATFGWLPGVASVIAVLVAKRFASASHQAVCDAWKKQL